MGEQMRVPLQEWISAQTVEDKMLWKGAFGHQMMFLRDTLTPLIGAGLDYPIIRDQVAFVISTHRSKSITLPVVSYERPDIGLQLVVRENFYNFKLSVLSDIRATRTNLTGVIIPRLCLTSPPPDPDYTGDCLAPCYFEGFPPELIFGYFDQDPTGCRWSAEIWGYEQMYTAVFAIMTALEARKPMTWGARKT
jgi:hypothetical protein